jgi:hypothetical protein
MYRLIDIVYVSYPDVFAYSYSYPFYYLHEHYLVAMVANRR